VVGVKPDGLPEFVAGMRGLVERNTMRLCLAIDSFLLSTDVAPAAQFQKRLHRWFAAVGRVVSAAEA
jgi:hypothetical protein